MTMEQFIRRNYRMYQRLEERKKRSAEASDSIIYRAQCLAEASVYHIAADDMLEILDCAEDIRHA